MSVSITFQVDEIRVHEIINKWKVFLENSRLHHTDVLSSSQSLCVLIISSKEVINIETGFIKLCFCFLSLGLTCHKSCILESIKHISNAIFADNIRFSSILQGILCFLLGCEARHNLRCLFLNFKDFSKCLSLSFIIILLRKNIIIFL